MHIMGTISSLTHIDFYFEWLIGSKVKILYMAWFVHVDFIYCVNDVRWELAFHTYMMLFYSEFAYWSI